MVSFSALAFLTRVTNSFTSVIFSSIQPWSNRTCVIFGLTSAQTVIQPAILPAFGCAPDIPPNPEVTNRFPLGCFLIFLNPLSTVIVVP